MSAASSTRGRSLDAFRSLAALRTLNLVAVGCSLAAATGAALGVILRSTSDGLAVGISILTTLVAGIVWSRVLRSRATVGKLEVRVGWVASLPLAIANCAMACGLAFGIDEASVGAFVAGALFGTCTPGRQPQSREASGNLERKEEVGVMSGSSGTQAPLGAFRSLATLRRLNVTAVGCSLAACTGTAFAIIFGRESAAAMVGVSTLTTLVAGVVWARMLRWRATVGGTKLRLGWVASVPLAMANAAIACGVSSVVDGFYPSSFLEGAVLGATIGAFLWIPALLATLFCFGLPIAWSQELADKGLAGEERGERIVGAVSAILAAIALLAIAGGAGERAQEVEPTLYGPFVDRLQMLALLGTVPCTALVGLVAGIAAVVCAQRRENARRAFVSRVEAGAVEGYRVDTTQQGKVLVRVASFGEGYRVARFDEPLFELADTGEARRPLEHQATLGRP